VPAARQNLPRKSKQTTVYKSWGLAGYRVTQICFNHRFVEITLEDSHSSIAMGISAPFSVSTGKKKTHLDPTETIGLEPLLKLVNQEATLIDMYEDGSVKLVLASGNFVSIPKDSLSESWLMDLDPRSLAALRS
jgi:hypothetical protein